MTTESRANVLLVGLPLLCVSKVLEGQEVLPGNLLGGCSFGAACDSSNTSREQPL